MRDETIKISIIVPIYNVEDYVKPCIESIIGQSYKNLEIILVDDGSTDNCPEICDEYAKRDQRIRVIHKHNGGVTSARKAGVVEAAGDYVLCVDGDDWIEQDRVEVLVRDGILPSNADMIYLSGYTKDFEKESKCFSCDIPVKLFENDEIESKIFPLMSEQGRTPNVVVEWMLVMWAIRRELLLKNQMLVDDRVVVGEDFLCICLCLLDAKSVMTIPQGGYHYIQRPASTMHQIFTSSDKNLFLTKVWYQTLKNQLKQKHASEKTFEICAQVALIHITGYDFDWILQKFPNYLFPFPNVNDGAQIVVYGAGKIGSRFIRSLDKMKRFSVVLWVDQNLNLPTVPGYTISSRDAIFSANYDFIVVAILDVATAKEVKRSLILDGIPEEKIATMDADAIL